MGTMGTEKTHCEQIGEWVAARCTKRVQRTGKDVPQEVIDWLDRIEWNPSPEDTDPTYEVLGWAIKTINDPDWLE
jgi:hypothetical protein